jgi:hypothetical protein
LIGPDRAARPSSSAAAGAGTPFAQSRDLKATGGLSLHGYLAGGMVWFAPAVLLSIVVALLNARVLLVEVLR